jgi:hypothetical protein
VCVCVCVCVCLRNPAGPVAMTAFDLFAVVLDS